jgi:hypothetical protein
MAYFSNGDPVTRMGKRAEDTFEPGTMLRISGETGTLKYHHSTVSSTGMVSLHLVGEHGWRAVRLENVRPVKKGGKI